MRQKRIFAQRATMQSRHNIIPDLPGFHNHIDHAGNSGFVDIPFLGKIIDQQLLTGRDYAILQQRDQQIQHFLIGHFDLILKFRDFFPFEILLVKPAFANPIIGKICQQTGAAFGQGIDMFQLIIGKQAGTKSILQQLNLKAFVHGFQSQAFHFLRIDEPPENGGCFFIGSGSLIFFQNNHSPQ